MLADDDADADAAATVAAVATTSDDDDDGFDFLVETAAPLAVEAAVTEAAGAFSATTVAAAAAAADDNVDAAVFDFLAAGCAAAAVSASAGTSAGAATTAIGATAAFDFAAAFGGIVLLGSSAGATVCDTRLAVSEIRFNWLSEPVRCAVWDSPLSDQTRNGDALAPFSVLASLHRPFSRRTRPHTNNGRHNGSARRFQPDRRGRRSLHSRYEFFKLNRFLHFVVFLSFFYHFCRTPKIQFSFVPIRSVVLMPAAPHCPVRSRSAVSLLWREALQARDFLERVRRRLCRGLLRTKEAAAFLLSSSRCCCFRPCSHDFIVQLTSCILFACSATTLICFSFHFVLSPARTENRDTDL